LREASDERPVSHVQKQTPRGGSDRSLEANSLGKAPKPAEERPFAAQNASGQQRAATQKGAGADEAPRQEAARDDGREEADQATMLYRPLEATIAFREISEEKKVAAGKPQIRRQAKEAPNRSKTPLEDEGYYDEEGEGESWAEADVIERYGGLWVSEKEATLMETVRQAGHVRVLERGTSGAKRRRPMPRALKMIAFTLLIAFGAAVVAAALRSRPATYSTANIGQAMAGKNLSLTVTGFDELSDITGFHMEEGYSYFLLQYSYTNIGGSVLKGEDAYPYVCVAEMSEGSGGLDIAQNSTDEEQMFDLNALKAYGLYSGVNFNTLTADLAPNETRSDVDVIRISDMDLATKKLYIAVADLKCAIPLSEAALRAN